MDNHYIIFIAGHKNHGKNWLTNSIITKNWSITNYSDVDFISNYVRKIFYNYILSSNNMYSFAFANKLKQEYCIYNNIQLDYLEKHKEYCRKNLQQFSLFKISHDSDYYTKHVYNSIQKLIDENDTPKIFFITDFRKNNEYDFFYNKFSENKKVILQKWFVNDTNKSIDLNDKWENNLNSLSFDIIFSI